MSDERPDNEGISRHPCSSCGADMVFDAVSGNLKCLYCDTEVTIASDEGRITETAFADYLRPEESRLQPLAKDAMQVTCDSCGATVSFIPPETATSCEFCDGKIVAQPRSADPLVAPEGILPFKVASREASDSLRTWTRTRWFAPNKLKTMASHKKAVSVYIPYWTYDSDTTTDYTGSRGEDYQTTETYRDSDGKTQHRTVTKTNWYPASGTVFRHFDDVAVPATTSVLPQYLLDLKWDLESLVSYDPGYLAGHKAQTYQVTLEDGFERFKSLVDGTIRGDVRRDIGGDRQSISSMETEYSSVTFKHVLVPVYAGAYRFNNKVFQVVINGRTGEVYGERPYSWIKIGCLVISILAVVLFVVLVLSLFR